MKQLLRRLLGLGREAVVVSFCSGPPDLAQRMVDEVRLLVPDRKHYAVTEEPLERVVCIRPDELPGLLREKRIGLAPTLFTREKEHIRRLAWKAAPLKVLAYNSRLERHHVHPRSPVASLLFLAGVPLDRIWIRPRWFPFRRDFSVEPDAHLVVEGRPLSEGRRRVAILTPYCPWPLSHGGAVRIFNLIREAARDFDVFLFAFTPDPNAADGTPLTNFCAEVVLFPQPRYREPRWATLDPPETREFWSGYVDAVVRRTMDRYGIRLLQVEYTQLARYKGDVLVEHDVTFDLYTQVHREKRSLSSRWDLWRWLRFEREAVARFRRVVFMSRKDAELLPGTRSEVIPNGVDLARFQPEPEQDGECLLFVGSFAHFPNVVAFRWFLEDVWPLLAVRRPGLRFLVIAGRDPQLYWDEPVTDPRIELHGFISDVRPFYAAAHVVVVPTRVSAGTNLKVIEAMAMQRAVVSTSSGCGGLELTGGENVLIADSAHEFAEAVDRLLSNCELRGRIASEGRRVAVERFGWERIGLLQRRMWNELLRNNGVHVRKGTRADLPAIEAIQLASHGASQWEPDSYFDFDVHVAERSGQVCGFLVSRLVAPEEAEILNVAVAPGSRLTGVATALIESLTELDVFLEVRESNSAAQALYRKLGFAVVGRREDYYDDPVEAALVMLRSRRLPL